jgi:hypothetical protein
MICNGGFTPPRGGADPPLQYLTFYFEAGAAWLESSLCKVFSKIWGE